MTATDPVGMERQRAPRSGPGRRRRWIWLLAAVPVAVGAMVGATFLVPALLSAPPAPSDGPVRDPLAGMDLDALERTRFAELRDFTAWLEENDAEGFIGEVGWPKDVDSSRWNAMAERWYLLADFEGLWTTVWATGTAWSDDYRLSVYDGTPEDGLTYPNPQADVLERHLGGGARHGVNLAGLEFGTDRGTFSSGSPGTLGLNYFAELPQSYEYLASRGIDLVRLPFRWERIQSAPFDDLSATGIDQLRNELDAAADAGIDVFLDLHNYGRFLAPEGELQVGTQALPSEALIDVWRRLSREFGDHPAVGGYGLMNEPNNFADAGGFASPAELWEDVTQQTLSALRAQGDDTLILVPGYDWSGVEGWRDVHPDGWIDDPADNFRYEAHHYWDGDASGTYRERYADVVDRFAS